MCCDVGRLKSLEPFTRHLKEFEMMNIFEVIENDKIIGNVGCLFLGGVFF